MDKIQKCLSGQGQATHLPKHCKFLYNVNKTILHPILNPWIGVSFQTISRGKQERFRVSSFLLYCLQPSLCYHLRFKAALMGEKKHGLLPSVLFSGEVCYLLRVQSSSKGWMSSYGSVAKVITAATGWELS